MIKIKDANKIKSKYMTGFAMLEVFLALGILAVISFGIYQLLTQSIDTNNLQSTEAAINQIQSSVDRYQSIYNQIPASDSDLINNGLIPGNLIKTDAKGNKSIYSVLGSISMSRDTDSKAIANTYIVSLSNLSNKNTLGLATDLYRLTASININGKPWDPVGFDSSNLTNNNQIDLYYPKIN